MKPVRYHSRSAAETMALGSRLARHLTKGDIVCLSGELGSGKTTFTKGIARGLRIHHHQVVSPSFVLLNRYAGRIPLFHFDFYRVVEPQEISAIGCEEYLYDDGIAVVEWAERLGPLLPRDYIAVRFLTTGEDRRNIEVSVRGRHRAIATLKR